MDNFLMKCPRCKEDMEKAEFDSSSGMIDSLVCFYCGFYMTDSGRLTDAMKADKNWWLERKSKS